MIISSSATMNSLGRSLIITAALATMLLPNLAVWNDTHIFSELWSPHARFHGAWQVLASSGLGLIALVVVLSAASDDRSLIKLVCSLLVMYWGSLFLAMFVPGTALSDPGKAYGNLFGIPLNPLIAGTIIILSVLGCWLIVRKR